MELPGKEGGVEAPRDLPQRPRITREDLEVALREAVASANEVAIEIQEVFELPEDDGGPRFK